MEKFKKAGERYLLKPRLNSEYAQTIRRKKWSVEVIESLWELRIFSKLFGRLLSSISLFG
jgi:hypothetical protein